MGGLTAQTAREADAQFEAVIFELFAVLLPGAEDFALAKHYLANHGSGLRAGDALHLAIAKTNDAESVYSLDKNFPQCREGVGPAG